MIKDAGTASTQLNSAIVAPASSATGIDSRKIPGIGRDFTSTYRNSSGLIWGAISPRCQAYIQIPVIVNLTDMDHTDAKRLVDFSAGLIFGLRGTIERITSNVFLLSPRNVMVAAEDKERIAGGFFNQS